MSEIDIQESNPVGTFLLEEDDDFVSVRYRISAQRAALSPQKEVEPILLIKFSKEFDLVTIFPTNTLPDHSEYLQPKYRSIQTIVLDGLSIQVPEVLTDIEACLLSLPRGFIKTAEYGLGIRKEYRVLFQMLDEIEDIQHLMISKDGPTEIAGNTYILAFEEFDSLRRAIDRIHQHALNAATEDKEILVHNSLLHSVQPSTFPEAKRAYRPDVIFKTVSALGIAGSSLSNNDQKAAVKLVADNANQIARKQPQELLELSREIEVLTLEELIAKFENLLKQNRGEQYWQEFFQQNPFILSLAFALPVIAWRNQVSVGGRKFDNKGEKIADFVCRNDLTQNLALIEIKTPATLLLGKKYREGVFPPSTGLVGAVSQVLDQRYALQKNIASIKDNAKVYDIEAVAVRCIVVAGICPTESDEQKSLELYRNSLHDVQIITFDELLSKLRHLLSVLKS